MKKFALVLALSVLVVGVVMAAPMKSVGPFGPHNPVGSSRTACYSCPADLNGLIASSELINEFGLATEFAGAFVPPSDWVQYVTFWGGEYNGNGCGDPSVPTFNMYFYNDGGCIPTGDPMCSVICVAPTITSVGCQGGSYPMWRYDAPYCINGTDNCHTIANNLYWFVAQACDHTFPPQWGRLICDDLGPCGDGAFWSPYFGFPSWVPSSYVFGETANPSVEFTCGQGSCGPPPVPAKNSTWGNIKGLYR